MPFINKSFYFLRHGETDWNKQQKIMGQSDIPLNETGVLQAKTVVEKIQVLSIDVIVTSPLKRAYKTAEIIGNKIDNLFSLNRTYGNFAGVLWREK